MNLCARVLIVLLLLIPVLGEAQESKNTPKKDKPVLSLKSSDYAVTWTPQNIVVKTVSQPESEIFSFRQEEQDKFDAFVAAIESDSEGLDVELVSTNNYMAIRSLVGPYLSYDYDSYSYMKPSAHPSMYHNFEVIDLKNPERSPVLTDIFAEEDIVKAMLQDKIIREVLKNTEGPKAPQSLAEFKNALQGYQGDRCEVSLDEYFLEHFAFHHVKGNQVAVRLGMAGDGPCRGALTQIGILLDIPPVYKTMFTQAAKKEGGILMKDTEKISDEKSVSVEFEKVFKESF